jgi:hypothetical protein
LLCPYLSVAFLQFKFVLYQFFMRLHRIRSPLAPLIKGGTGKTSIKVPLIKGSHCALAVSRLVASGVDLGGSRYVQLHIKLVLDYVRFLELRIMNYYQLLLAPTDISAAESSCGEAADEGSSVSGKYTKMSAPSITAPNNPNSESTN